MAKRRRASSAQVIRVGAPRAPAPIIRLTAPAAARPKKRRHHRRRSMMAGLGSGYQPLAGIAIGGAAYGFAVKQGWVEKLPALPLIGRTGAAAIALAWWANHGGGELARNGARAAAAIAGYQLGSGGSIVGEETSDGHVVTEHDDSY